MTRTLLFAVSLFTLSAGFASADLLVKAGDKIAFLGDSITQQGWGVPGGYVQLTVAGLETLGAKVEPIPAGISGHTSRDMLARLQRDVLDKKPTWMTLSCGVNDVWHGANGCTLEEYQKNITSIVDQAQAAGIKVLIMTSTPIGEQDNDNNKKLVAYNYFLHQLAVQRHLPVAEENAAFQDAIKAAADTPPPVLTGDGVHPKTEGSLVMAKTLLAAFGATPAQLDQVQAAWMDKPSTAVVHGNVTVDDNMPVTLNQYTKLKAIAATRKMTLNQLLDAVITQATAETFQAHLADPVPDRNNIQNEAKKAFETKIVDLTK